MKKRIISALLAVCLVIALGTVGAFAEGAVTTLEALNSAITDADGQTTITLGADITGYIEIPAEKNIILDLNGHKLVNADTSAQNTITVRGTLTINDSSSTKTGVVDNQANGKAALVNYGTTTLNAGTFDRSKEASTGPNKTETGGNSYYTMENFGTMTINSGVKVQQDGKDNGGSTGKYSSLVHNGYQDGTKNESGKPAVMTINGGVFSGGLNTIKNDDYGELTINNGTFTNMVQAAFLNWNVATVNGGTFEVSDASTATILNGYINDAMDKGQLTITGGTFNSGSAGVVLQTMVNSNPGIGNVLITGGTFTGNINVIPGEQAAGSHEHTVTISDDAVITGNVSNSAVAVVTITDGAKVTGSVSNTNTSGKVSVTNATIGSIAEGSVVYTNNATITDPDSAEGTKGVASVNGEVFSSLKAAIDAAPAGATVELLSDTQISLADGGDQGLYEIAKNLTVNGNNHKITVTTGKTGQTPKVFNVTSGKVVINNLIIDGGKIAQHGIQAYGANANVTLNNVTSNNNVGYGVLVNAGAKVTANVLNTYGNGWGGVNVEANNTTGSAFTMTGGTLAESNSVVIENSGDSAGTTTTTLNSGNFNNIMVKGETGDTNNVRINGGSYNNIVGDDKNPANVPNKSQVIVASGATFRNSVSSVATTPAYQVNSNGSYTYYADAATAAYNAPFGATITYVGSGTASYTVTFRYWDNYVKYVPVPANTTIYLPSATRQNYTFGGWSNGVNTLAAGTPITVNANLTFTAVWKEGQYDITIDSTIKNGKVWTNVASADATKPVFVYYQPNTGYKLDTIKVYQDNYYKTAVKLTYVKEGVYSFTMPAGNVIITATFKPDGMPFTDVRTNQWFYDPIYYVWSNGMMEGDTLYTFNPDGTMTRAMFWAVLGRIDGQTITGTNWKTQARNWAMSKGVSDGTNPDGYVTREQMVTMLWRYAGQKNGSANLNRYTDSAKVSAYAVEAMRWAIGNGIIEGMTATTLAPQGNATRAQCAAIFMRYDKL